MLYELKEINSVTARAIMLKCSMRIKTTLIEHSLAEVSRLIDNYEFDKAKQILNSKIEFLQEEDFLDYQQKLKIKSLVDAEDKYLNLEKTKQYNSMNICSEIK